MPPTKPRTIADDGDKSHKGEPRVFDFSQPKELVRWFDEMEGYLITEKFTEQGTDEEGRAFAYDAFLSLEGNIIHKDLLRTLIRELDEEIKQKKKRLNELENAFPRHLSILEWREKIKLEIEILNAESARDFAVKLLNGEKGENDE